MQNHYRAIVIDDVEYCRDLLTDFLTERGYEVISLPDVTNCPLFPARESTCPKLAPCADVLLLDNRLPFMTGTDFLELLEDGNCYITAANKAIFSGYWTEEERGKAEQINCKTFAKPYDLAALGKWLDDQEKRIPQNRQLADSIAFCAKKNSSETY